MKSEPLITVGLPYYNDALWLNAAINSIVNQTYKDWELILMDDGSSDGSTAIAESWLKDPRIRLIRDGKNRGLTTRLNQIVQSAKGRFIARMDADDIMVHNRLERQVNFLLDNPNIDLIGSQIYSIDIDNRIHGWRGDDLMPKTRKQAIKGIPIVHPSVMARREWYLLNPYYPVLLRSQDFELWLRTLYTTNFHIMNEKLLFYREVGIPYTKKYVNTNSDLRRTFLIYINEIGLFNIIIENIKLSIKEYSYRVFDLFKKQHILIKKRNHKLTNAELIEAESILKLSLENAG